MNPELHDLDDLLDRPLPGEPAHRPAAAVVAGSRRALRRRRLALGGAAGAVVAVAGIAGLGLSAASTTSAEPVAPRPTSAAAYATPWPPTRAQIDERYPEGVAAVECLAEHGVDATLYVDGGLSADGGDGDGFDACVPRYPAPDLSAYTDTDWHELYDLERDAAGCLREHDIDVPRLPAFSRFVEHWRAQDPWTAYGFVTSDIWPHEWDRISWECPQPRMGR